ncbi:unnamed protein product [Gongylonema pulchrum]|uniref:Uncharacterized protein n=1 Tax=Gongylonema pulchrum TaxID=637853 RepID=A0A183E3S0_9BILA|nr:unnamed protein product [Gongylonema pulchrum]
MMPLLVAHCNGVPVVQQACVYQRTSTVSESTAAGDTVSRAPAMAARCRRRRAIFAPAAALRRQRRAQGNATRGPGGGRRLGNAANREEVADESSQRYAVKGGKNLHSLSAEEDDGLPPFRVWDLLDMEWGRSGRHFGIHRMKGMKYPNLGMESRLDGGWTLC